MSIYTELSRELQQNRIELENARIELADARRVIEARNQTILEQTLELTYLKHPPANEGNKAVAIFEGYVDGVPFFKFLSAKHVTAGTLLYSSHKHP